MNEAIEVLANIYNACSSEVMVKIHDHLVMMPNVEDDLLANAYSRIIKSSLLRQMMLTGPRLGIVGN